MTAEDTSIKDTGLRGVTVASSRICRVDGQAGKLIYRGYSITDLAEKASFEEVAYLMLYEHLPKAKELENFKQQLSDERTVTNDMIRALQTRPADALPMDILQGGVSLLANDQENPDRLTRENQLRIGVKLIAKTATIMAAWHRIRNGKKPLDPDPNLSHAANFLYMLTGEVADDEIAHIFDTCLVLHAEHSFNASAFSARQIASTRAHMYASISGAAGSLSGELHGGANARVMQMLIEIGSPDAVDDYIEKKMAAGEKIMGLGHAVYKTKDPRAIILGPMVERMGRRVKDPKWYNILTRLEEKGVAAFKEKKGIEIYPNVDFYSGALYYYMGIPVDLFTPVFAISRSAGWVAHIIEEQFAEAAEKPALYRPSAEYVGDYCGPAECEFVPMENR
ncbi:MAG: citrate/2-methylcitrate synthase [Thermodesulfobacteriota bacterium]